MYYILSYIVTQDILLWFLVNQGGSGFGKPMVVAREFEAFDKSRKIVLNVTIILGLQVKYP